MFHTFANEKMNLNNYDINKNDLEVKRAKVSFPRTKSLLSNHFQRQVILPDPDLLDE